jgi:hypothetical protein
MQTYRNLEIIVIDDGSKDGSLDALEPYPDQRVRIVRGEFNMGLSARLNELSALASGAYIARMDADDLMHPDRIARQVAYLQQHPDVDVVGTGMYLVDECNRIYGYVRKEKTDQTKHSMLRSGYLVHPSVIGKREWFLKYPYSSAFPRAEDRELWLRTCDLSVFAQIAEPLHFYRRTATPRLSASMTGACTLCRLIWANSEPERAFETLWLGLRSVLMASAFCCTASLGIVNLARKVRAKRVANDACVAEGQRILARIMAGVR